MICNKCKMPMFVDHVEEEDQYVYTCVNPNCTEFRKAMYGSGEGASTHIRESTGEEVIRTSN